MFDGLRKDASKSDGFDENQVEFYPDENKSTITPNHLTKSTQFLGMTAKQRFLIAIMLMIMVMTLGAACMLISGSFVF